MYDDGELNESDIDLLNNLNNEVSDSYTGGKISNEYYTYLKKEISTLYDEIYEYKIRSIVKSHEADVNQVLLEKIKEDIANAYSKDRISKLHYDLLTEKISKMTSKENNHDIS